MKKVWQYSRRHEGQAKCYVMTNKGRYLWNHWGKKIPCKNRSIRGWYVYNFHNAFICVYVCKMHRKLGKCLPNCDKEEHNGSVSVPLFSSFL